MQLIKETDYGTPASKAEAEVSLTIDGFEVTVPAGTSVMRAAMELGVKIPKLCATDSLEAFGSCRMCLVQIEGRNGTPASSQPRFTSTVCHMHARLDAPAGGRRRYPQRDVISSCLNRVGRGGMFAGQGE